MKITIQRANKESFLLEDKKQTLLESFRYIKKNIDRTFTFSQGCRSGVCGSCACIVDGKEVLACKVFIKDNMKVEPLKNLQVIRDLVVENSLISTKIKENKSYILNPQKTKVSKEDVAKIDRQSNCILCQSCYSSCPVYEVNPKFAGPYVLSRVLRYVEDKKEENQKEHIDIVQNDGIWDCTMCGNCTMVCPQYLDPKGDIQTLRNISVKYRYMDPNFASFGGGFDVNGFGLNF